MLLFAFYYHLMVIISSFSWMINAAPLSNDENNLPLASTSPTVSPIQILSTCKPGQYFKRDCKLYISCENGKWRRNFCPENKFWNQIAKKCDDIHNVPECYEMHLQIQRNAKNLFQQRRTTSLPLSTTLKNEQQNGDDFDGPVLTTTPMKITTSTIKSTTTSDYDEYNDDDDEEESAELYSRHEEERPKPYSIEEKPYFSSKDYEDYDDDDDETNDHSSSVEPPKPAKRSHQESSSISSSNKNDILTDEDTMYDFKKLNKQYNYKDNFEVNSNHHYETGRRTSSSSTVNSGNGSSYGKICIVRGKTMECHDFESTTSTTTLDPVSSTTEESSPSPIPAATLNPDEKLISQCQTDSNAQHIHSYSFKIEINIDDRFFQRIERIIRLCAYYISFQFWK